MEEQNYPIRHFEQMGRLATELKALPAQVLEHGYSYESFGSWWTVIRFKGVPFRLSFDGHDGELVLERSASRKPPYNWGDAMWRKSGGAEGALEVVELIDAIRSISSAG